MKQDTPSEGCPVDVYSSLTGNSSNCGKSCLGVLIIVLWDRGDRGGGVSHDNTIMLAFLDPYKV